MTKISSYRGLASLRDNSGMQWAVASPDQPLARFQFVEHVHHAASDLSQSFAPHFGHRGERTPDF